MCTAAKKLKNSLFSVIVTKGEKKGFDLIIRTESFIMETKQSLEGHIEQEGFDKDGVEVTLNGQTFTSLFKIMSLPGTGFISNLKCKG